MKKTLILLFPFILCMTACEKEIFQLKFSNDPVGNFESFWQEFDQVYGLFLVKNIDWDSMYMAYRPNITEETSDEELYTTLVDMLEVLNDGHTALVPVGTELPNYIGGVIGRIDSIQDFDIDVIKGNYLSNPREADDFMLYDHLTEDIGYLHIYGFGDGEKAFDKEMGEVLEALKDVDAMVIDIRGGYGGEDIAGKVIASYFTDQRRLYMTNRVKNGPGENDFTELEEWYIEPRSEHSFSGPVILLTNRLTISARETFQLAMMILPQVTMVGDTTAGAFSNNLLRELPNGWAYSLSIGEWKAADGTSYEGLGIPPDYVVQNQLEDLLSGKDEALEKALDLLR